MNSLVKKLMARLGLRKRRPPRAMGYDFEAEAMESIPSIRANTMVSLERLITLYQQARHCDVNGIQGAFVECGVWKGGSIGLMALANLRHGPGRRNLHLFDIFEEICEPDEKMDGPRAVAEVRAWTGHRGGTSGSLTPMKGFYDRMGGPGTLEDNRELLENRLGYPQENIFYHKGWFQDTLPACSDAIGPIAILRLDGDWYASTKVCLDHLYDHVVRGGIVIIDDYATYDGCRKAVDEFVQARGIKAFFSHVDADCRYWIKP